MSLQENRNALEELLAMAQALPDKPTVRISDVTLLASAWVSVTATRHEQVVQIEGVTENSQVDLTPTGEQLEAFFNKQLTFTAEQEGGVVTVVAVGDKPQNDYTIQVTITEVHYV